ncbi:MAG: hypothetical protein OCC45_08595 [Desulfotalea sp.]
MDYKYHFKLATQWLIKKTGRGTQQKIAEYLEMHKSQVSKIVNGHGGDEGDRRDIADCLVSLTDWKGEYHDLLRLGQWIDDGKEPEKWFAEDQYRVPILGYTNNDLMQVDTVLFEQYLATLSDQDKYALAAKLASDLGVPSDKLSNLFIECEAHPDMRKGSSQRAEFLWLEVCKEYGYNTSIYPNDKKDLFQDYVDGSLNDNQFSDCAKQWLESVRVSNN